MSDTETEGRLDCLVLKAHCEFYSYQCDSNGEVAICHCTHPDNPENTEGNCRHAVCPITKELTE